jgi:serine/threonine protein kinase
MSAPPDPCRGASGDEDDESALTDPQTAPLSIPRRQGAVARQTRDVPAAGSVLRSRYVLEEIIGRGGTSTIFRARDLNRSLPQDMEANFVAVKLLRTEQRADPQALTCLKREFRQMQCLSHPGIVRVFDLDCDGDIWFMSMELVAGRTVKTLVETSGLETSGSPANALQIITACCEALEHAHSLGILHADLKPTNVMVADDGTAKLIDFGSAPLPSSRVNADADSLVAVTPLYASPQVLAGKCAEARDDVFSLACLSYNILSGGRHPFGGRPSLEDGRAKSAPTYVRSIPPELFEIIERGLSAERERRPASAADFLRELTDAARRRRADATRPPVLAREHAGVLVSRSTPFMPRNLSGIVPARMVAIRRSWRGGRSNAWRVQPLARPVAVGLAMIGAAFLLRLGSHRDAIRVDQLPVEASVMSPQLLQTASVQNDNSQEASAPPQHSGVISFEAPKVHASAMQSLVAITVKRLQSTRNRGAFVWRVQRGTAYPGVDYERIAPQIVSFIEGQTVRTLYIPLIRTRVALIPRGSRTFTVELEQIAGGPALGRYARVTVAIDPPAASNTFAVYQARAEE